MPLIVASAPGAIGSGYGTLLAFARDGTPLGAFSNDILMIELPANIEKRYRPPV